MTWRTVVITKHSKLEFKLEYLIIKDEDIRKIHLSEISTLIVESTAVSLTAALLYELSKRKIKTIFCDEKHNPYGELTPYYGCTDSPDRLRRQITWEIASKERIWAEIIREKIRRQAMVMRQVDSECAEALEAFAIQVEPGDNTNREGHAAKIYFNTLFGKAFSRRDDCEINGCLNYGYAIILSAVSREIVGQGYNTQLGIFHHNTFNHFNLACDMMEPLRPLIDLFVLSMDEQTIDSDSKTQMANILNEKVKISGKVNYLNNAIRTYVKSVADAIESNDPNLLQFCDYGYESDETDSDI